MVDLGNNGFTNPIISSFLEISAHTIHFLLDFRFLSQLIVTMFARLTDCIIDVYTALLPPGDHALVQNSWHLLEYKLFKAISTL